MKIVRKSNSENQGDEEQGRAGSARLQPVLSQKKSELKTDAVEPGSGEMSHMILEGK